MKDNLEKVKLFARDLRNGNEFPRSPRETLAGYVLAARALDKCRADESASADISAIQPASEMEAGNEKPINYLFFNSLQKSTELSLAGTALAV